MEREKRCACWPSSMCSRHWAARLPGIGTLCFCRAFSAGLGFAASACLGPVYIAELAPARIRGRLVGMFQINIVIGILLAYLSNFLIARQGLGGTEWRWQFGVAALPAVLFLVMLFGIPQSPRWLVTQKRVAEAREVLQKMGGGRSGEGAAGNRYLHPSGELGKGGAALQLEVPLADFSGYYHWYVQPALRHQRHPLLPQRYFRRRWVQQAFGRPASSGRRRTEPAGYAFSHGRHRQAGTQDSAANRLGRHGAVPGGCRSHFSDPPTSGIFVVVPGGLHRIFCHFARRGDLGLHQ